MNDIKKSVKSYLPKYIYFEKKKESIAIVGSRRGGTTFLASLLSTPNTRIVDQPLEAFSRNYNSNITNLKKKILPPKELYQYFNITQNDKTIILKYLKDIENGCYPTLDLNFGLIKNNIVYKFVHGGFMLDVIIKLNIKPIILFRHPISQSLSCIRNKWGNVYKVYLESVYFRERFLNKIQLAEMIRIDKFGSELEKGILDWYCGNIELLKNWRNYSTIFYEDLVLHPDESIEMIESKFKIRFNRNKLNKPSGSSFLSEKGFKKKIGDSEYKKLHLKKPFEMLSIEEKDKIQDVFEVFNIDIYHAYSPYPQL